MYICTGLVELRYVQLSHIIQKLEELRDAKLNKKKSVI